jgi:hypothetical protein
MDEPGVHNAKQNKPDTERQVLPAFSHMWKQTNKIKT